MWIAFCLSMSQVADASAGPDQGLYRDLFGVCVADGGDLDGDGTRDVWVGDPSMPTEHDETAGHVWAVSGKSGKRLRSIASPTGARGFGWTLAALDDGDGDGKRDVAVGCEFMPSKEHLEPSFELGWTSPAGESAVFVFSGATSQQRFVIRGPADCRKIPWYSSGAGPSLASVGDWNGDGVGDLAVGWSFADTDLRDCGRVDVVSGKDGATVHSWTGADAHDLFGFALAPLADLDGDGKHELACGAMPDYAIDVEGAHPNLARIRPGYVRVLSSKGSVLFSLSPADGCRSFGVSVGACPDVDRDSVDDVMVGQPFSAEPPRPAITLWSGKTGKLIRSLDPPELDAWDGGWEARANVQPRAVGVRRSFGVRLLSVPDRDGDGLADILVTVPRPLCFVPAGIVSSASGNALGHVELHDYTFRSHIGLGACRTGDIDGDSDEDFAIGGASIRSDEAQGAVVFVSSKKLEVLRTVLRSDVAN
ncbi:MAG: hypothetical protein IT453_12885 [Planctomycetes bacterium]|nr:hypothetical protein [Planctomycetota bacterium]